MRKRRIPKWVLVILWIIFILSTIVAAINTVQLIRNSTKETRIKAITWHFVDPPCIGQGLGPTCF